MATAQPEFELFSSLRFDLQLLKSLANSNLNTFPSPFYMLSYHRDRILEAASHFGWSTAAERISGLQGLQYILQTLEAAVNLKSFLPRRVRIVLHVDGTITVQTYETPAVLLENLFPSRIPPPVSLPNPEVSPVADAVLTLGESPFQAPQSRDPLRVKPWLVLVDPKMTAPSPFTAYKTTFRDMYTAARNRAGILSMTEPKEVLIVSSTGSEIMEGSLTSVFLWRGGRWVTPPTSSGGQAGTTRRWLLERGLCSEEIICRASLVHGEECWISNGVRGLIWGKIGL